MRRKPDISTLTFNEVHQLAKEGAQEACAELRAKGIPVVALVNGKVVYEELIHLKIVGCWRNPTNKH